MIYLYGASGHCKVILDILRSNQVLVNGLIDNDLQLSNFLEFLVYHSIEESDYNLLSDHVIISIGNNAIRKKVAAGLKVNFGKAIHKSAQLSDSVTLKDGTVVMANVSINADSSIGEHCILNTNSSIDHDCILKDFVHISPNVALAGNVEVEEGSHIGIGAAVVQGIKIGKWATIGAGAIVIKDVPDFAIVVGNPARIIKYSNGL